MNLDYATVLTVRAMTFPGSASDCDLGTHTGSEGLNVYRICLGCDAGSCLILDI